MHRLNLYLFKKIADSTRAAAIIQFHFWERTKSFWKNSSRGNQSGFALVLMTVLIGLTLTLVMSFGSSLIFLRNKMRTVHQCRTQTLEIQKSAQVRIEMLVKLNPLAQSLRIQLGIVQAQIVAATALGNTALLPPLIARRQAIRRQQRILDKTQKGIIKEANIRLNIETLNAYYQMRSLLERITQEQRAWSANTFQILPPKIPKLAMRPSDGRIAPTYGPKKDFERKQAVSLFWMQHYEISGWLKNKSLIPPQVRNECHATLEEKTWLPKIRKDKRF